MDLRNQLLNGVLESLDDPLSADELSRRAHHSRSSFFRLCQALVDESPGALRRRILLERAAWHLLKNADPVTAVAFDAQFESLEGFTRAFKRAYGVSPSIFRRAGRGPIHLPAPNEFHYCPPQTKGKDSNMDLFEVFTGTEAWHMRQLLNAARGLKDEQLDRPIDSSFTVFPWPGPDRSLREILERIVETKEVWSAALTGGAATPPGTQPASERTPKALLERFERAEAAFLGAFTDIRKRGAWDDTFVDALCEPPETFTYGGVFCDIVTFNAYRRIAALDVLNRLGVKIKGSGSPIEYQESLGKK